MRLFKQAAVLALALFSGCGVARATIITVKYTGTKELPELAPAIWLSEPLFVRLETLLM